MKARLLCACCVAALLPSCADTPSKQPAWQSIEISGGPQHLDEDSWAPIDSRVTGALTWSGRKPDWPCGIEIGFQYARSESQDDSVARYADFYDVRLGAAGEWRPFDRLSVVCGAGPRLGIVNVTRPGNYSEVIERDSSFGVYAHVGAFVHVYSNFSIGVDGQWADGADYDVIGDSRNAATSELLLALRWEF
jgi:hypothetical protein